MYKWIVNNNRQQSVQTYIWKTVLQVAVKLYFFNMFGTVTPGTFSKKICLMLIKVNLAQNQTIYYVLIIEGVFLLLSLPDFFCVPPSARSYGGGALLYLLHI